MRLPNNVRARFLALGLTALLAACGRFGGGDRAELSSGGDFADASVLTGPSADYPVVVGDPYMVGETLYTPIDTMNYDEVGYAVSDGGAGVTVANRTLPMPSYVEITALDTGKTILARVERRGPMTGNGVVALSNGAQTQLDVAVNAPIRIRRVNPPEFDRAKLRTGEAAPIRMDTPKSLLAVLKRKLSSEGSVNLASKQVPATALPLAQVATVPKELTSVDPSNAPVSPTRVAATKPAAVVALPKPTSMQFDQAFTTERKVVTSYPLAPLDGSPIAASAPLRTSAAVVPALPKTNIPALVHVRSSPPKTDADGNFVIQAGAFSSKANADRAANSIDGFVQQSGRYFRVRMGPFVSRGQAEAALAKVRAAGYKDARVFNAG